MIGSKLRKLIQPIFIHLVGCTVRSDNVGTPSADNRCSGDLSKVTSSKVVIFAQIIVVQDVSLKSLDVS